MAVVVDDRLDVWEERGRGAIVQVWGGVVQEGGGYLWRPEYMCGRSSAVEPLYRCGKE
jgi:hypothetical protein